MRSAGISAERKAIYDDIAALEAFGYDIVLTRSPKPGYFLASRAFEAPEVYLLCDAVQAAGFITPKKTRELTNKLGGLLSEHQAKSWQRQISLQSRNKCDNEEIYYNIDIINRAISARRKIRLKYRRRYLGASRKIEAQEREMVVSPYALTWAEDHYYLVGNNAKYDNLLHLRLDRMRGVTMLEEPWRHFSEVSDYKTTFDIADYTQKSFHMFGGELSDIVLKCKAERLEQVIDRFSEHIFIRSFSGDYFTFSVKALLSEGLTGWLLQFGKDIEVLEPQALRYSLRERAMQLAALYEKE